MITARAVTFRRQYLRRCVLVPSIGIFLFGYFMYHTVQGERGLLASRRLTAEVAEAESTLAELRAERSLLERRADALNPRSVDLDLLDEQARRYLGYARPDELIIYLPDSTPQ